MSGTPKTIEQVLSENGCFVTTTSGVSMRPLFFDRRDTVVIEPLSRPVKKYDVLLYKRGTSYVLHRVVKCKSGEFVIRGDNCINNETDIKAEDVIGIMTSFYRKNKHYSVNSLFYRIYYLLHVNLYPVRMFLRRVKNAICK